MEATNQTELIPEPVYKLSTILRFIEQEFGPQSDEDKEHMRKSLDTFDTEEAELLVARLEENREIQAMEEAAFETHLHSTEPEF